MYDFHPLRLLGKRAVGMASLLMGRARRFDLGRLDDVVARASALKADHVVITGDLTTTALPAEFAEARRVLGPLLTDPSRATVLPGNHDRYTGGSVRYRAFEEVFGAFAPAHAYPWLRRLDGETAILGLDPNRPHLSARGYLPRPQLDAARRLLADPATRPERLIVACHYPLDAPAAYRHELAPKRLEHAAELSAWLATIGPHLYCCGHVHAAWAFVPEGLPDQLCLNAGAPLLRDPTGRRPPGFLEIALEDGDVQVTHHAWADDAWTASTLHRAEGWFAKVSHEPMVRRGPET